MLTLEVGLAEFFLVIVIALSAIWSKTIDGRGFLASVAVGLSIVYGGGPAWFVLVAMFFVLGVAFTFYQYSYKKKLGGAQEKGGARNWPNVLANGGAASVVAVFNFVHPSLAAAALFLGAVSTAAADTAATELGLLSKGRPRLITNLTKRVPPGTSGGVSSLGFAGAALASLVIGVAAAVLGVTSSAAGALVSCVIGGVGGTTFDSLLGAAVQRKGYCRICMKPTELVTHCGEETRRTGGSRFIENNTVNLLATCVGAAAGLAVYYAVIGV